MTARGHGDSLRQRRRSTRVALRAFFGMAVVLIRGVSLSETPPSALGHDHSGGSVDARFSQGERNLIRTSFRPEIQKVDGLTGVNYQSEPYKHREEIGYSSGETFQPCQPDQHENPVTPLIGAQVGYPVRIRVCDATEEQNQLFSAEKCEWPIELFMCGVDQISVVELSGSERLGALIFAVAAPYRTAGDYVRNNPLSPYAQSGQWGYPQVLPLSDHWVWSLDAAVLALQQVHVAP